MSIGLLGYMLIQMDSMEKDILEYEELLLNRDARVDELIIRVEDLVKKNGELEIDKIDLNQEIKKLKKQMVPKVSRGVGTGELIGTFEATAYCPCEICCGKWAGGPTKSGEMPKVGRTIAVDPKVIPLGSKVSIEGLGLRVAEDTGSAVKGNIVDIFMSTHQEALNWGRRKVKVYR